MKKIFISHGMRGKTEEQIRKEIAEISTSLEFCYNNDFVIIDSYLTYEKNPVKCLAQSINSISEADIVCFFGDWENYRGCCIEHEVCKKYGIPTMYLI